MPHCDLIWEMSVKNIKIELGTMRGDETRALELLGNAAVAGVLVDFR